MKGRNMNKTMKFSAVLLAFVLMLTVCTVSFATAEAGENVLLAATDTAALDTAEKGNVSPAFVVVLGVATVFIGLFALIIITKIMSWCCKVFSKKEKTEVAAAPVAVSNNVNVEDRKLLDAVIAATIATYMGTDCKGLRINSIKKI
ncbi:MAG: OadG family protein [Clostridia bacterium]|nr:OadG family protein [Clostridia bacterium]